MSRKRIPVLWFSLILILILGTAGVAYGLWSQNLIIMGTVNTGTVDAAFSLEEIDQMADFNDKCILGGYSIGQDCDGDTFLNDDMEVEDKDIAECDAEIINDYTMEVTVSEAYPAYNCFIKYNVENTGSIPLHVYGPAYFYEGDYWGNAINYPEEDFDNRIIHVNGWPPVSDYAYKWSCAGAEDYVQLHPGDAAFCHLHINLGQAAEQGATYKFQIKFFARQWNEMVLPDWVSAP